MAKRSIGFTRNGDLYVAVELNNTDEGAREINKDKAQPRLYRIRWP